MMDNNTLGQIGFEAYRKKMGGLTYDGKQILAWEQVSENVKAGWEAAAFAVLQANKQQMENDFDDN